MTPPNLLPNSSFDMFVKTMTKPWVVIAYALSMVG